MPRLGTYFESDASYRQHTDERLCHLESSKDCKEMGGYAEVVAVCSCGRRKDYFANEVYGYVFLCNGGVIMKHNEKSMHLRDLKRTP